jgi:hypothetical protein
LDRPTTGNSILPLCARRAGGGRGQARIAMAGGNCSFEFGFKQSFQDSDGLAKIDGQFRYRRSGDEFY